MATDLARLRAAVLQRQGVVETWRDALARARLDVERATKGLVAADQRLRAQGEELRAAEQEAETEAIEETPDA